MPERWDARTGSITPLTYVIEGERTAVPIQLGALGSTFVVFRRPVTKASHTVPVVTEKLLLQVDGAWDVEFKHPNGALESAKLSELGSWTESANASVRCFPAPAPIVRLCLYPLRRTVALFSIWARCASSHRLP